MTLKEKILFELKTAMKSGDAFRRDTLRYLDSAVKNAEIEKKKRETGLNDEEIVEIVARSIKQRKDSISQYEAGGRADLAEKESREIDILAEFMPEQLDEEEIRALIKELIQQSGVSGKSDIGKLMGVAMGKLKGKADGNLVKKIAESELG